MCTPGLCGKWTMKKQDIFLKIIEHQMNIIEDIYKGSQWYPYLLYDLFGGPGYIVCNDGYDGPTSTLTVCNMAQLKEFDIETVVAERDPVRRDALMSVLPERNVRVLADARDCLPYRHSAGHYGLVYMDPPMNKEGFEIIRDLSPVFADMLPKVDILMYLSATYFKRFNGAPQVKFKEEIVEIMNSTNKEHWFVCEVGSKQRYVFILGSNFDKWAHWRGIKMYSVKSKEGWLTLEQLSYEYVEPIFETYGMKQTSF